MLINYISYSILKVTFFVFDLFFLLKFAILSTIICMSLLLVNELKSLYFFISFTIFSENKNTTLFSKFSYPYLSEPV